MPIGASAVSALTPDAAEALSAASDLFNRMRNDYGYMRCPEHGVDHTGKSSRSIVIDCALHRHTGEDRYLSRARQTARGVVARLAPDPEADGAWVFFPGLHDYRNNSTNIIDAGECVDALATLLMHAGDTLDLLERQAIEESVRLCCETYLIYNVVAKPVTNQRLWGAMGLAAASVALDETSWRLPVKQAIDRSLAEMRPDGSFRYVQDAETLGEGVGISDLTVYYHSRCVGFSRYALRLFGAEAEFEDALRTGADFLCTVLRPDGLKPLGLEGKRWFWDADTEAGSSAYDAYVLATDGRKSMIPLACRVAAQSVAAVTPSGFLEATSGSTSFVCRVFHTADLAWLARAYAAAQLDERNVDATDLDPSGPIHAADAGVARIGSRTACAIVRTDKRPADRLVGGRVGGGGLVYVGNEDDDWRNMIQFESEPDEPEASWSVRRSRPSIVPGSVRSLGRENRFVLHIARSHARAGRWRHAAGLIWRHFSLPMFRAHRRSSSSHATKSTVHVDGDSLVIMSGIADKDGTVHSNVGIRRTYRVEETSVLVRDELEASGRLYDVQYRLPVKAKGLEVKAHVRWTRRSSRIRFGQIESGARISLGYRI